MTEASQLRPFYQLKDNNLYSGPNNEVLEREYGKSPGGVPLEGAWVLRDKNGKALGWDKDLQNLARRWNIRLIPA